MRQARIRVLPPDLARKIAAGEVVERPASVVRELVDNSLDAGATVIRIDIRDGGLKSIRVTDNGTGIPVDDINLAFTSHATSKISRFDDLEHLLTLGFRGEALPSIAAVARVEVITRMAEANVGTRFHMEPGAEPSVAPVAAPVGTRVHVMDLFANVPARRKFVRSLRAESGQIAALVCRYVLANPHVRLVLSLEGRETVVSAGTGNLLDAVACVHGPELASAMIPVRHENQGIRVDGFVSPPAVTRQNRTAIDIAVNGRPVGNRGLIFALEEAYSGYVMAGRHPVAFLHVHVAPGDVDANVHPSKSEVRFSRDREVHGVLHRAVADALLEVRLQPRDLTFDSPVTSSSPESSSADQLQVPAETERPIQAVPQLRVFGQANQTFIIAEGPDGLYMIDQHAAHERILFDRLDQDMLVGAVASQPLLEPAVLSLGPAQMEALESNGALLARLGFLLEARQHGECEVRALPVLPRGAPPLAATLEVLDELAGMLEPTAARERALASLACRAAVKAGQTLDVTEMREIVAQLERTQRPSTCPHGRPTMIHLSHSQLEREFGRR